MARCACNEMTREDCDCPRTWTCNCGASFTTQDARYEHTCPMSGLIIRQQTTAITCDGCEECQQIRKQIIEERDRYRARYLETQRQLDEARALVEAATCFAFGGTSRPAFAYRTQFGHVDNDVTWCAGVPEGDDVECESRDSAIAKARALAEEDGNG